MRARIAMISGVSLLLAGCTTARVAELAPLERLNDPRYLIETSLIVAGGERRQVELQDGGRLASAIAVPTVVRIRADARGLSPELPVALAGARLYRGASSWGSAGLDRRTFCGASNGNAAETAAGGIACLRDNDGDGFFDSHFRFVAQPFERLPVVTHLFCPEMLEQAVPYDLVAATDEDRLSVALNMEYPARSDWGPSDPSMVRYGLEFDMGGQSAGARVSLLQIVPTAAGVPAVNVWGLMIHGVELGEDGSLRFDIEGNPGAGIAAELGEGVQIPAAVAAACP